MPLQYCLGLYDEEKITPAAEPSACKYPKEPVRSYVAARRAEMFYRPGSHTNGIGGRRLRCHLKTITLCCRAMSSNSSDAAADAWSENSKSGQSRDHVPPPYGGGAGNS
jgi:hypothetical protein